MSKTGKMSERAMMSSMAAASPNSASAAAAAAGVDLCKQALRDDPFEGGPFQQSNGSANGSMQLVPIPGSSYPQPRPAPPPLRHPYHQGSPSPFAAPTTQQQHPYTHDARSPGPFSHVQAAPGSANGIPYAASLTHTAAPYLQENGAVSMTPHRFHGQNPSSASSAGNPPSGMVGTPGMQQTGSVLGPQQALGGIPRGPSPFQDARAAWNGGPHRPSSSAGGAAYASVSDPSQARYRQVSNSNGAIGSAVIPSSANAATSAYSTYAGGATSAPSPGAAYRNGRSAEYGSPHSPNSITAWRGNIQPPDDAYMRNNQSRGAAAPNDRYGSPFYHHGSMPADDHRQSRNGDRSFDRSLADLTSAALSADEQGASPAQTSSKGSNDGTTSKKRKRLFKYLTDAAAAAEAGSADGGDGQGNAMGAPEQGSRKKVKKACLYCKRSHMPCEVARPCARCTKRGIAHLCKEDAENEAKAEQEAAKKSKSGSNSAKRSRAADAAGSNGAFRRSVVDAERNAPEDSETEMQVLEAFQEFKPKLPISLLLSDDNSGPKSRRNDSRNDSSNSSTSVSQSNTSNNATAPAKDLSSSRQEHRGKDTAEDKGMGAKAIGAKDGGEGEENPEAKADRNIDDEVQDESPEFVYRGGDIRLDSVLTAKDQLALEKLLEGRSEVFELNDAFGDKPTGMLSAPLGVASGESSSTLAAMIPWKPRAPAAPTRERAPTTESSTSSDKEEQDAVETMRNPFLREEALTAAALRGISSYNYTWGYAKLAVWMNTRFSRESCASIDRALGKIRPKFLQISKGLSDKQLLDIEEEINRSILHYKGHVFEYVPFAMLLLRRTGEIYGANERACRLMQLPKRLFSGGQLFHFQLVKEADIVQVIDKWAEECLKHFSKDKRSDWEPPTVSHTMEIDRSLFLHDKPAMDPRTGELLEGASETLEDGSPAILRIKSHVTIQARINELGLPIVVCLYISPQ